MAITVQHGVDPRLLGRAAFMAGRQEAVRDNTIRSIAGARDDAQFAAQMGQQNADRAMQAGQFQASRYDDMVQRMSRLFAERDMEQMRAQQAAEELAAKQAKDEADRQFEMQKFQVGQENDVADRQLQAQRWQDDAARADNAQAIDVDDGIRKRMEAASAVQLDDEGKRLYQGWAQKQRKLQEMRRPGGMLSRPSAYAQAAAQLAAEYDALGLDLHVVPVPSAQEKYDKSLVKGVDGKFKREVPGAHGSDFVPADDSDSPNSKPSYDQPFDPKHIYSAAGTPLRNAEYKDARNRIIEREMLKARKDWKGESPPTASELEAIAGEPKPEDIIAEMDSYINMMHAAAQRRFSASQQGGRPQTPADTDGTKERPHKVSSVQEGERMTRPGQYFVVGEDVYLNEE